jgi:uncharacterized protein YbaR (Trm112 family)
MSSGLDPALLAILACPADHHGPLRQERDQPGDDSVAAAVLVCPFCRSRFPIRDGIPVLLADDATPGPNGLGVAAEPERSDPPAAAGNPGQAG